MTSTHAAAFATLACTAATLFPFAAAAITPTGFPGTSIASPQLQSSVAQYIDLLEVAVGEGCKSARVVYTEVIAPPARANVDPWVEQWTVDRCGVSVYYRIELRPNKRGGTDFGVSQIDGTPPDVKPPPAPPEGTAEATSRWRRITAFGQGIFYVDFGTLKVEGLLRTVWELRDLKWMSRSGAWSFLVQNQYDCEQPRYRALAFRSMSGHMGEGDVVQSETPPPDWETDFTAESPAGLIRQAVCEYAAGAP